MIEPPPGCLRITAEAWRYTLKWPFRCTAMTASNSSSLMLNSIRSRRLPATQATPSIEPHVSMARVTISSPVANLETSPAWAIAVPPAAVISATTASATSLEGLLPSIDTP